MKSVLILICGSVVCAALHAYNAAEGLNTPFDLKELETDRRDPFCAFKPGQISLPPPLPASAPLVNLDGHVSAAEKALADGMATAAIEIWHKALKLSAGAKLDEPQSAQLQRLESIRRAAERMRQRTSAEDAFAGLKISITGILARGRGSLAIINGKLAAEGDWVPGLELEGLSITAITSQRVIFVFRGYHIACGLPDTGR